MRAYTRRPHPMPRHLIAIATVLALGSAQAANYTWSTGFYGGPATLLMGDTLDVLVGGTKYLNSALANQGSINAYDNIYFINGNVLSSSGTFDLLDDVGFYNGGYNGGFNNSGVFRKSAGAGTSYISISGFVNSGLIQAQTGIIRFNTGATFNGGSQFDGAGQVMVSNGATFNGAFFSTGLLTLSAGVFTGGAAQVNGTTHWTGGRLDGTWEVAASQSLLLGAGATKYINGTVTNAGTMASGDDLYFLNNNLLANQGLFDVQGDFGLYDGGYGGQFSNTGLLRKSSGGGTGHVSIAGFTNSGVIEAQAGTIKFNVGAVFNHGSHFTGAGTVLVSNGASFNGTFTNTGHLVLSGGVFSGNAAVMGGPVSWSGGRLDGNWTNAAGNTVNLETGVAKYINGTVTNQGTMAAGDGLYFLNGQTLHNQALYDFQGDFGLFNGGYDGVFDNTGLLRKSAGTGTSYVSIDGFVNTGTIEAQTGTIKFDHGGVFNAGTQFTGAGTVLVSNGASFNGAFTNSGNLVLGGGIFTGTAAIANGPVSWTGGRLDGDWTVAAGSTLSLDTGNAKYINGTVNNQGTMVARDPLYFLNGQTLNNAALYDFQGDHGLHNGGYDGNFVNTGTLRKSDGAGISYVAIGGFSNAGVIEAQTGTIHFSNTAAFHAGSHFAGAGQVVVAAGGSFDGAFTSSGHLVFQSGNFNGAAATMDGDADWTGGRFDGNWQVAAGRTLHISSSAAKYVNATMANHGRVEAAANVSFLNDNTMTNEGEWDMQGDVGLYNGGYGGNFINNGRLVKSAGTGVSHVGSIGFTNNGVVDVQVGTIQLPSNFSNAGTLMGVGSYATNAVTNAGHVAPGASPGTLTLSANFVQTAAGSLDIELENLTSSDLLLVNGNATLGGTLALSCWAACSYAVGDMITVLDATGSLNGTFAGMTLSGFATGAFETIYDLANARVVLHVTEDVTAIPEPGNWALMLGGLAVLGWLGRRRPA